MLTRWHIEESPTKADPHRHILMLHAAMEDIQRLVRTFGSICGRPKRKKGSDGYNYSLMLHGVTDPKLKRIDAQLKALASAEPEALESAYEASIVELVLAEPVLTPRPAPELGVEAPFKALSESPLYGAGLSADAAKTFESLIVGAHNRSAHAAAMAVVTHPGTMYNPLFISGSAGTGKTHILHAIARKLQEYGDVWLTSGPRISLAADLAARAGKEGELREKARGSKALIIDDAHLLGVTEGNRELLAEIIKISLGNAAQIVLSSAYPARLLGTLEEALGLRIASGQAAELKFPAESMQREILHQIFDLSGFEADPIGRDDFVDALMNDFVELNSSLRRLNSLKSLRASLGQSVELRDLLATVCPARRLDTAPEDNAAPKQAAPESDDPSDGKPVALFYPQGRDAYADGAWGQLRRAAQENGWPFPLRRKLRKAYDPKAFNVPFLMADECRGADVESVLVIGPEPGSDLADMETQFRHTLERLLGTELPMGWLPYERSAYPMSHVLAYLDMRSGAAR